MYEELKQRFPSFPNISKDVLVRMVTSEVMVLSQQFINLDIITKIDGQSVDTIDEVMQVVDEQLRAYNVTIKRENNASVVLTVYIVKSP